MGRRVRGVRTVDTNRPLDDLLNACSDPVTMLALCLAESGLKERSKREATWPDVSYGLTHPAVKWLNTRLMDDAVFVRAADGTLKDIQVNRDLARIYFWDAERAIVYTEHTLSRLLQTYPDPLEALCRYNKPSTGLPLSDPRRTRYANSLREAKQYVVEEETTMEMPVHRELLAEGEGWKNYGGVRPHSLGIVIHSTRGGQVDREREYNATLSWFRNRASQVSAHLVIGDLQTALMVPLDHVAWHAGMPGGPEHNSTHLAIELVQPKDGDPYSDRQYTELAKWCAYLGARFGFPTAVFGRIDTGLIGHELTPQGKKQGKSDPGRSFSWLRLDREIQALRQPPAEPDWLLTDHTLDQLVTDLEGKGRELGRYAEQMNDVFPVDALEAVRDRLRIIGRELLEIPDWLRAQRKAG